jgi:ATP-dependent Lhr-like helicase
MQLLRQFHPAVAAWFEKNFAAPTAPQKRAWPAIHKRKHTLIAAPTGSGKTLAAFLAAIDDLVRQGEAGTLKDETQIVYVSPLKALSNDVQKNLQEPLKGIRTELERRGRIDIDIRASVRTGDTPPSERAAMLKKPPHILVTTPESLYLLLTSEKGAAMLRSVKTVIVDEIHAMVSTKRGSHLALSLERLEAAAAAAGLLRIGLSATQRPMEAVAEFLLGARNEPCTIIDSGHYRKLELAVEVPESPLEAVMSNEVWEEIYDRLTELVKQHRTTLIFVNTRRMAERVARHLGDRLGDDLVTSHHGSLAKDRRLSAENRLKSGNLRALVATASLELGIDIGSVDLVCQIGSPRSISGLLQRVGRSGHAVGGTPRGRIFPLSRDELIECTALVRAVKAGELDRLVIPEGPLDVLAQQIVAAVAGGEWGEDELFGMVRKAYPYRNVTRADFDAVVEMLAEGYTTRLGRHNAYLHHDKVQHQLRARRSARLTALTSGGAIPDNADYDVVLEPNNTFVGTVNEDFAIESMPGDVFQLGNTSWRILRVERGQLRVEDALGQPPSLPFWIGEAPGRTPELSEEVSRLRGEISEALFQGEEAALALLAKDDGLPPEAAKQIVEYLSAAQRALGTLPTQDTIVMERFFDESGGMQLILHSPFGSRLNRAWGLALRKRFCRKFNFELQAAATEDAIILSLGASHSFPMEEVFQYLNAKTVRDVLVQAMLVAPMFNVRWRWNANISLAILRRRGGKKNPPQIQRMQAEDLVAAVFPDQIACAENLSGPREVPDHPLVKQTVHDCLTEAMDIEHLERLLTDIAAGKKRLVTCDLTEPSPLAAEILTARPYAFLDDAPLEERRTQAVMNRRWLDPQSADELGRLDAGAIERVRDEVWPKVESADELHDALTQMSFLTQREGEPWRKFFDALVEQRRAAVVQVSTTSPIQGSPKVWAAAERLSDFQAAFPEAGWTVGVTDPTGKERPTAENALVEILRGRLEGVGVTTAAAIAHDLGIAVSEVEGGLLRLEAEGFLLRGKFSPSASETEWCARRLLARIHRYTINRLRQEIEPVSTADYIRFLLKWQGLVDDAGAEGPESLARILEQLEGYEAPAAAWEGDILPVRMSKYDPSWLDTLCMSGKIIWKRLSPPKSNVAGIIRTTPIALLQRKHQALWNSVFLQESRGNTNQLEFSANAQTVLAALEQRGALFFTDLVEATRLLPTLVENALGELVAFGLVTADSYTGLRAIVTPSNLRPSRSGYRRRNAAVFGIEDAGRWSLLQAPQEADALAEGDAVEKLARAYLKRYGVVFRKVLEREAWTPPWRELLYVYRRLEARGEIRGGRFVTGYSGEQFALSEAIESLRRTRKEPPTQRLISVSAADPMNMIGILTAGGRLPANPANRVLYRDGEPTAVLEGGNMKPLLPVAMEQEWELKKALVQKSSPPRLRAYLGRQARG